MSQHNFNIPNEAGAPFRADVNSALQALASLNAGTSAPSTTYAYQPWYDTTLGLLKIRNGANSAWVIIGPLADSTQHVIYVNNLAKVYINSSGQMGVGVPSPGYAVDVSGDVNVTGAFRVGGTAIPTGYTFINGGTSGNSGDTYTSTPSPAISAYAANQMFLVFVNSTNTTTTPTFNFNGQGAKTVKKQIGGGKVALSVGDLQASTFAIMAYDGTDLILLGARTYAQGANIASAGTINLDTATGDYAHVTGTTTITAVTLAQGRQCTVVFDGVLTFTHGSSLILPGAANITTAAGDVAVLRGEASGVVRCIGYVEAAGSGGGGGMWEPIKEWTLSASTDFQIIDGVSGAILDNTYVDYLIDYDFDGGVSANALLVRTSDDLGVAFDSGGSDYKRAGFKSDAAGGLVSDNSSSDSTMRAINESPTRCSGTIEVRRPWNTSFNKEFIFRSEQQLSSHICYGGSFQTRESTAIVNAIQLFNHSMTGKVRLFGKRAIP